jgi:hypothetical protein
MNGQHADPGKAPTIGIWCMNCHGGIELGGMHGTNAGIGISGPDTMGEQFLNGSNMEGIRRPTYEGDVGKCWTIGAEDAVNTCTKGHGGVNFGNSNYDMP